MPKLAKTIDVNRRGKEMTLTIDGDEFPYYLRRETTEVTLDPDALGTVTITLFAEHVTITDDTGTPVGPATSDCRNHQPHQHRDGKPPWCNECGLTESGQEPQSRSDRDDVHTVHDIRDHLTHPQG